MSKDSLGDRLKGYECTYKYKLLDRMYTIIRLDGKAFHTYTKGLNKPFDKGLVDDMIATTQFLCEQIQGVKLGYVQSDEITLVLTDFDTYTTQSWFDNEIQKMVSISSSLATAKFNQLRLMRFSDSRLYEKVEAYQIRDFKLAHFDSRVFQVPTLSEAYNCLLWRQQDCIKNSISATAYAIGSHKESQGLNGSQKEELIFQRGELLKEKMKACGWHVPEKDNFNWNDLPAHLKRGMSVFKKPTKKVLSKDLYDKDKSEVDRDTNVKKGWHVVSSEHGTEYFKMVQAWTQEALEFPCATHSFRPIPENI